MRRNIVLVLVALSILVGAGLIHAVWTDRWGFRPEYREAAARLRGLPTRLGDWTGEWSPVDPEQYPEEVYGAGVSGRYVNETDGSQVTVYLAVGRPGPLAVHTPELCYGGGGFHKSRAEERFATSYGAPPRQAVFTHAAFSKTDGPLPQHVRVLWSWGADGAWQAHASPRVTLARHPLIHKLYLIKTVTSPAEPLDQDPIVPFLHLLLAELDRVVHDQG